MKGFLFAWRGLTSIPLPGSHQGSPQAGLYWFALVGALLGVALALAAQGLLQLFPPQLAAAFLILLWAMLTGALHLDGLADSLDGLLPLKTAEQRLAILKDPNLGSFGAVGLILHLLLKWQLLSLVLAQTNPWALVGLVAIARLACVYQAWRFAYARPQGTAQGVIADARFSHVLVNLGFCSGYYWCFGNWIFVLLGVGLLLAEAMGQWATTKINGITGDLLGFTVELVESVGLVVLLLWGRW